ncbi:MAG: site-specific integrase [Pseudomonadales bacterium]|nr:site-specific integrase [Pseudomonadales bacterium]
MPENLTAEYIDRLSAKSNRYVVSDIKTPGLAVMVYPTGNKSFLYRYKLPGCKTVQSIPLGSTTKLSVKAARLAAKSKAGKLATGNDPKESKKKAQQLELSDKSNEELQLFNYIEKYYTPYAREHSVTADDIVSTLKREFDFIKDRPINKISIKDIEVWRSNLVKRDITFARVKRIYTYLKACINTALKHYKLIDSFEIQHYSLKRKIHERVNDPKIRYLSKPEEKRLLKALNNRDQELREKRANYIEWQSARTTKKKQQEPFGPNDHPDHVTPIITIAYNTGFDLGDIFDFDWQQHIDFPNNQIRKIRNKTKHKNNNPQPVVVPMSKAVREILTQWGEQHGRTGRVFKSPRTGGRINNLDRSWMAIRKNAKLKDFRLKDLRHTFASWLAIKGESLIVIRDLMGHKNITTTEIYAHLCPNQKNSAIAKVFGA